MDTLKTGKFLADLRKESGLTQEELGNKIGVTNKTISRWENGNYMPPVEALLELSELYEISINEILTGRRLSMEEYKENAEKNIQATLKKNTNIRNIMLGALVIVTYVVTLFANMEQFIFGGTPDNIIPYIASLLHAIAWIEFLWLYKSYKNGILKAVSVFWGIVTFIFFITAVFNPFDVGVVNNDILAVLSIIAQTIFYLMSFLLMPPFAAIRLDYPYAQIVSGIIGMIFFVWGVSRVMLNRKMKLDKYSKEGA